MASGSMRHFIWQQQCEMDDELFDRQHKEFFDVARKLVDSRTKEALLENLPSLYHHVKEHFSAEEGLMDRLKYPGCPRHEKEHNIMLRQLVEMDCRINADNWNQNDTQDFVDGWGKHIIHADMSFNNYLKEHYG